VIERSIVKATVQVEAATSPFVIYRPNRIKIA